MRKSWLALIFGLSVFALLGAECDTGGNIDDDKGPLPPRALAATPLLRTYYQTQQMPKEMRSIKIPEGDAFDPDELTLLFDMVGTDDRVEDVRVRLHIGAPPTPTQSLAEKIDLFGRVIAPDGTTSAWKHCDLATGDVVDMQAAISFMDEFDDIFAEGVWKLELRDPIKDNDGRALFRNATLRINNGEISALAGQPADGEIITHTAATGNFAAVPELNGGVFIHDFAVWGVENMLINTFTMTQSFSVNLITVTFTLLQRELSDSAANLRLLLIAPSGGYFLFTLTGLDPLAEANVFTGGLETEISYWSVVIEPSHYPSDGMPLYGEPSQGTWTLALADIEPDGNTFSLISDTSEVGSGPSLQLDLSGVSYP
ncbi:MAG: hypothetical protein IT462_07915 [Planctomycetes bacterium]|nr:hypothetical protein [Planctomycetota bacterium]